MNKRTKNTLTKALSLMLSALMLAGIGLPLGASKAEAKTINSGGDYGTLSGVSSMNFDDEGTMYILNAGNDTINLVDPDGTVTRVTSGGIFGTLDAPSDIAFDSKGNTYIVNSGNNSINKIDELGSVQVITSGGIFGNWSDVQFLEAAGDDTLYIGQYDTDRINKVSPEGAVSLIETGGILGTVSSPYDMAIDSDGVIYISNIGDNSIMKIAANGDVSRINFGDYFPSSLALDSKDNLYVGVIAVFESSYAQIVVKITPDIEFSDTSEAGVYGDTHDMNCMAFDSSDNMYLALATDKINKISDMSGTYTIESVNSSLLMDVTGGGMDQGVNIIQWPSNDGVNQQWVFERLENGYYKITSALSGMSLDVYGGGADMGNRVIQWPYHGGTNQQWVLIENEDGSISFMSRLAEENGTRYLLDVYGGGKDQGVNVIQWASNGGDNQKWTLSPVVEHSVIFESNGGTTVNSISIKPGIIFAEQTPPTKDGFVFGGWYKDAGLTQKWNFTKDKMPSTDLTLYAKWEKDYSGTYNIRSLNSGMVMDVYGGGTDQGVNVIQWPFHGQSNQQWQFESLGNGYYKVTSVLSGMSLDVYGGGTDLGNRVIQWPYHGGTNQQWRIIENSDGTVSLMSRLAEESGTGYLLDVFGGGTDAGVNVIQWTAHYGKNQKWSLEAVTE